MSPPEAELSPPAFRALAGLVHQHSRVRLGAEKQGLLANRLRPRVRQLGLRGFEDYADLLRSRAGVDELDVLVDLATTHHTHFFREPAHFDFVREVVLPELGPRLRAAGEPLRAWSAACSSGEEAWSLAMLLAEAQRDAKIPSFRLEASDISASVLERARRAVYPLRALGAVDPARLTAFFEKGIGPQAGNVRVAASLRRQVHFHRINLFGGFHPVPAGQHLIFCRNTLIYFDTASQVELGRHLCDWLAPGGWLVIGSAESLQGAVAGLESAGQGVYRRTP